MKSLEKLRKVAETQDDFVVGELVSTYMEDGTFTSNENIGMALGNAIDEIEQELSEGYVRQPLDMYGEPREVSHG